MSQRPVPYRQLIDYAAGTLPPDERQTVESYLAINPEAAEVVARFRAARDAMQAPKHFEAPPDVAERAKGIFDPAAFPTPESWWDRLQQFVATLIYDNRAQPAAAGVRGHGGSVQLAYACESAEIDLQAEPINPSDVDGEQTQWRLIGQVGMDASDAPIDIAIFKPGETTPLCELTADSRGSFAVELSPGHYELRFGLPDQQIVLSDVHIP